MIAGTCASCAHAAITSQLGASHLTCLRSDPTPLLVPGGITGIRLVGLWPPVEPEHRCGEFHDVRSPDEPGKRGML